MENKNEDKALRYDDGKILHELLPPHALNELAKVYTMGAKKYAPNNWRKGMKWSRVFASLKRHLNYFENGIDFDKESELLHMSHVVWNAITLLEYYKIYPEGDDRVLPYLSNKRIGLDIDEVLCDFTKGWAAHWGDVPERPTNWNYDRKMSQRFKNMKDSNTLDSFFLNLEPKFDPDTIPFEPVCYVTARVIDTSVTEQWLDTHRFPGSPVYTVGHGMSKVEALQAAKVEIYVDDNYANFVEVNNAGILCYLWDAPHNKRYDVGYKRINSLDKLL